MRKFLFFLLFIVVSSTLKSQELNALVTINDEQIGGSNKQVFSTLQKQLTEYINQTKWTNKDVKPNERINCAFTIIVNSAANANNFGASIQIQSTRPVFNSSYASPVLNIRDEDFSFQYKEFEPLLYNKNSYDSNLISTITYYVYIILGVDADTFKLKGGDSYLKEAENVMLQAQQSGLAAWSNQVGKQNRFSLIDNLLSSNLGEMRKSYYKYHRNGLDVMAKEPNKGKQEIANSLIGLQSLYNKTVGNNYVRRFFDAKADEIVNIFSDGDDVRNKNKMVETLQKISSNNNSKWRKIN